MITKRKALCYLCFMFAGILPLAGQDIEKPKKPGRSAWFACISSLPDGVKNPVKVLSGEELTELEIPRYMTSAPVKITDDGLISIVREVPNPEKPEETKYLVLARAKIPETVREALIILAPLPKPDGDLLFAAIIQDLADFKGGDRLYINLSKTHIRVNLGTTKVMIKPKEAKIYESPNITKPTNVTIKYDFYHPTQKKWKMMTASTVVLRPTRRKICVFNNGSRLGNIKKHNILFPIPVKPVKAN